MKSVEMLLAFLFVTLLWQPATGQTFIPIEGARDVAFDNVRNRIYVPTKTTVERYDIGTNSMLSAWAVGADLVSIDILDDSSAIYVTDQANSGTQGIVRKVNPSNGSRTNIFYDLAGEGAGSYDLAVLNSGNILFTSDHQGSGGSTAIRLLNTTTDNVSIRQEDGRNDTFNRRSRVFRSPDGSRAFMADGNSSAGSIRVYDSLSDSYLVKLGLGRGTVGFSATFSSDGGLLAYEGSNHSLVLANSADFSAIDILPHYRGGLGFSPRDLLFAADLDADLFRVYDPTSSSFVGQFELGYDAMEFGGDLENEIVFTDDGNTLIFQNDRGIRLYDISSFNVEPELRLGDINGDDTVNFLDISPFIGILAAGEFQDEADIDRNEIVNFFDISPFIALLGG